MERKWTDNQQMAINARGCSLLVSAAAGSGKTAVLVERVIKMITDSENPVDADRLLVVTFTKAAASEMKERISARIDALLKSNPYDSNLRRQQSLMSNAHISTIDSFCSEFVREHFYLLDISNDFRIADESELSILKNKSLETALDLFYENNRQDFAELADAYSSSRSDDNLQRVILKLYSFLQSHPFPNEWMEEKLAMYDCTVDSSETVWGKKICEYALSAAEYGLKMSESILSEISEEPEVFAKPMLLISGDIEYFRNVTASLKLGQWDKIVNTVHSFSAGRFTVKNEYTQYPLKLKAAKDREVVKSVVDELKKLFFQSNEECKDDIKILRPIISSLFDCVKAFDEEFSRIKRLKNIADFNDLEHWTLQLLVENKDGKIVKTETAKKAADSYDAVMLDEYQDANEVQDLIFSAISKNEKNLFVVGDVKQSIYGFRQSMPEIFLSRKENSILYKPQNTEKPSRIILDKNFRSRSDITESVNFLFDCLMSKEIGDMDYTGEERLSAGAEYPQTDLPSTQVHLLEPQEDIDSCTAEARYIAELILQMKNTPCVTENGRLRFAQNSDFAILLRSTKKRAQIYVDELKNYGIFAYSEINESYLDMPEIEVAINFLRIIDNPLQDIPLLSVLMSPVYGFTADDMANIRAAKRNGNLYSAVLNFAHQGDEKCVMFLNDLNTLRTLSVTVSVDILINRVYEMTGLMYVISAAYPHSNAVNNLRLLQEYAKTFENNGYKGLSAFVSYIDTLQKQDGNLGGAADDRGALIDGVRVMSIHKSKGLEFPICILADTKKDFVTDSSKEIQLHGKMGFASKRVDKERMCRYTTMPRESLCIENARKEKSEELRILYVAMTRAKEKLIMVCTSKGMKSYVQSLSGCLTDNDVISPYIVRSAKRISDWIIMASLLHPCAEELRKFAGRDKQSFKHTQTADWSFSIQCQQENEYTENESDNVSYSTSDTAKKDVFAETDDCGNEFIETVKNRISFKYKNQPILKLPVKIAASELAHKDDSRFDKILSRPAFLSDSSLTAAQKGTALHTFMQYCDFEKARQNPSQELHRLLASGRLSKAQADSIDLQKVCDFVNSDVVLSAIKSRTVCKEYRFTVKIDAGMLDSTLSPPHCFEQILLQGAVDLAYEKDGSLVIVDYKTDRVKDMNILRQMYENQLLIYKTAMEQCTDYKVSDCIIYSIYNSEFIKI